MFLDFFEFHQQPFGVTPDPAFLYLSPAHREALADLSAGIKEGRGFMALIAPPGMGKTTLLYQLMENLHGSASTAFLFQTLCEPREFFQYLLRELRIDSRDMDAVAMHAKLNEMLFAEMIAGRRFVLIVDEAQNLSDSVLETVRMLSNFETSHTKLLQIVLSGQPQLAEKLRQPHLLQLRQRIAVLSEIEPLSEAETARYVEHRVRVAGYAGAPLFDAGALSLIARHSLGIPRSINNFCYHALAGACASGERVVTREIAERVCRKLNFGWAAELQGHALPGTIPAASMAPASATVEMAAPATRAENQDETRVSEPLAVSARMEGAALAETSADETTQATIYKEPLSIEAAETDLSDSLAAREMADAKNSGEIAAPVFATRGEEATTAGGAIGENLLSETTVDPKTNREIEPSEEAPANAEDMAPVLARVEVLPGMAPISYTPSKRFHLPRWDYRVSIAIGALVTGGLVFGVMKFMEPSPARAASVAKHAEPSAKTPYSADPQEIGAAQVVTVAAMPQQTLKDLATLYLGRYDEQILSEIQLLNPGITDTDHLQPGQLIRLPLPQGSFREGAGIDEQP